MPNFFTMFLFYVMSVSDMNILPRLKQMCWFCVNFIWQNLHCFFFVFFVLFFYLYAANLLQGLHVLCAFLRPVAFEQCFFSCFVNYAHMFR